MCETSCTGLFLNEMYPNVQMLMFADDIIMLNDTIGRLQQQSNCLNTFCKNYMLQVNLSKTNIIIFRNGGKLRGNEKLYFNGSQVEAATYYKYLGINFSSSLKWSMALKTLAQQANKSLLIIRKIQGICGNIPVGVCFKLFDKMVAPILLYGSEVWGYDSRIDIENVHIKFCKYVLGLSRNTPNCAVLGECGRVPLAVVYMSRCIKYWIKLVQVYNPNRYPKCCYDILFNLDSAGRHTWATNIKLLLYRLGFGHVWLSQGVGNINMFLCILKQRLTDINIQDWSTNISNMSKLSSYRTYKHDLVPEIYIYCVNYYHNRKALSKLRCSNHRLAIERLRGTIERKYRYCKYCLNLNIDVIEDEYHFVMICPLYENIRQLYLSRFCIIRSPEMFIRLMSSKSEIVLNNLSKFVFTAFNIHTNFMGF